MHRNISSARAGATVSMSHFLEFFGRFHKKFQAEGFSVEAFQDLHRMTSAWITSHILQVDTQLMPFAGKS